MGAVGFETVLQVLWMVLVQYSRSAATSARLRSIPTAWITPIQRVSSSCASGDLRDCTVTLWGIGKAIQPWMAMMTASATALVWAPGSRVCFTLWLYRA